MSYSLNQDMCSNCKTPMVLKEVDFAAYGVTIKVWNFMCQTCDETLMKQSQRMQMESSLRFALVKKLEQKDAEIMGLERQIKDLNEQLALTNQNLETSEKAADMWEKASYEWMTKCEKMKMCNNCAKAFVKSTDEHGKPMTLFAPCCADCNNYEEWELKETECCDTCALSSRYRASQNGGCVVDVNFCGACKNFSNWMKR